MQFSKVAKVGLPIVLYNIPGRTGILMSPTTVARLCEAHPGVFIGYKASSGDMDVASEVMTKQCKGLAVLSGDDSLTLPLMAIGAKGAVSVLSNVYPKAMKEIVDPALKNDFHTAAKAHVNYFPLMKSMFCEVNPVPVKAAMALAGMCNDIVRGPLAQLMPENQKRVSDAVEEFGIAKNGNPKKKAKKSK